MLQTRRGFLSAFLAGTTLAGLDRGIAQTTRPGLYPGRTRHYHAKVQRPGGRVLTTQLYFPGEPDNRQDGIFDEKLLMRIRDTADGKFGRYDFVLL